MIKLLNKAYRTRLLIFLRKELFTAKVAFHAAQGDLQQANLRGQITVLRQLIAKIE